ncbi:hypothetical protein RHGRI_001745 [Rhododendron griersonianum]|uniref:ATP-dependent DNA helicase n=1 Tax=Rhododendron griersonianum TaxID=479676 RepID=A0AAV6LNW3_9ERIC|nr:hypothetical protein RHGRI_001745 [Rhododendron griersonianum]
MANPSHLAQTSTSPSFMPNPSATLHTNRPTLTNQVELGCEAGLDEELEEPMNLEGRHYLGTMDIECRDCKALHWMDERLTRSSTSSPLFGTCCLQGKEIQRLEAIAKKGKVVYIDSGKENSQVTNGNMISKATLAQRTRQDHKRNLKQGYAYQLRQRLAQTSTSPSFMANPSQLAQTSTSPSFMPNPSATLHTNRPTLTNQVELGCEAGLDEELEEPMNLEGRHYLGTMDIECHDCKALHWMDERLTRSSTSSPLFGTCCLQGKVRLNLLLTPPSPIRALYDGDDDRSISFQKHARGYNATNAFTSLGATLDPRVLTGSGPTSFTIHGELRHRAGSLMPQQGNDATYAQLYIFYPTSALEVRNRNNEHLRRDVLEIIQDTLLQVNPFVDKFRQAYAILEQLDVAGQTLPAHLHYSSSKDRRTYNLPTIDEIAVVIPGDGSKASGMRDIVLHLRGDNQLMQINECHPVYLPLHYVLLFPHGELGWEPKMKQWDVKNNQLAAVRLTQMDFYSYRLFERHTEYSTILRGGKLFQEFLVDAWAATEQNRLTYYNLNQARLCSSLYQDLTDIGPDGLNPDQVGQRFILPSSFTGSPRHMFEIFQDSMAITRYNHHPDIFLTITANPKWPEITSALLPHQTAVDRPDLVSCVFELKRKALMKEVEKNKVFGQKVAHVYTIEFQKRGLPHMHVLFFLKGGDKIRTCAQVDQLVCAEFPNPEDDPELFETVKSCMVHGPCGAQNPHAACMEKGKCTKRYPRDFVETTTMDKNGYPIYRRCDDGKVYIVRGHEVDNRDVVPYNPHLSKMFSCHINVEVCAGMRCVKYIHKYIYKGYNRTTMVLGSANEIKQYLDGRYIGPPEAAWHIFGHHMHEEVPTVTRLALHLPGMHRVNFNPRESLEDIIARVAVEKSNLTRFFAWYAANPNSTPYTYQEFPQYFVWNKTNNVWTPRKFGFAIGRMYFASPNCGEKFYLRLLLTIVKGPKSYKDLRTVDNVVYDTFKSACVARGLLEDDDEWVQCLEEAAIMQTGYQLRRLFCVILTQCSPLQPLELWKQFFINICDDLPHKIRTLFGILNPTEAQIEDYGLYLLNQMLEETDPANAAIADFLMEVGTNPREVVQLPSTIGNRYTYLATDKMSEDDEMDRSISNRYPNEYLNSLDPTGLPPFKLELKVGCPIILLRNIAPEDGLCNGTRMMVVRRQFPVRLAYAMTINKSQGQSVKFVGVDLRAPVFSHGQLYVALSRCTSFDRITILLPEEETDSTTNIVYPEILL